MNGHGCAIVPTVLERYSKSMGNERSVTNRRLGHSGRRTDLLPDPHRTPGFLLQLPKGREGWLIARRVRVVRRGIAVLAWTLPAMLIQAFCLALPGRAKVTFARVYWATFARLIGIQVRVVGTAAQRQG